ncbi:type II toxin-antitoxin system VapC family toxin [Mucilaginibacter terrigena]|uniref:Type II toxin-antitoxin system VapC family toxin n=1 Tax=Mucilaginibacter terrigena TaxID=2492395 RepID=A0A4Q5LIH8_9SPHI|nr:type II toxin-antitoxin system VapC family toxin [Mucilaginibacter terrigena]RYU86179.1 type II toxin-antitoxin system VapC family toxin [Mucilaginibacter terrigena]
MFYVDTDVLIHSMIKQNPSLHLQVKNLLDQFVEDNKLSISWLSIQETAFVLGKLNQPIESISLNIDFLIALQPAEYGLVAFNRATELAKIIGFKDFNDCLHTAIAEQHCTDLYTCNFKDFERIKPYTTLNIHFI